MPSGTEVVLVKLIEGSEEYKSALSKVDLLKLKIGKGPEKIVRVQNCYLWGCYLLKKAECIKRSSYSVTGKASFHVTAQSNIYSITQNNFDWRRSVRTKFGCGGSFSPSADYANKYCNRDTGFDRAIIVARVLVGSSHNGGYSTILPSPGYDTTVGNRGQVYVKYYDHEFYPEYVIYYDNAAGVLY
jgi:hypothetical protein